MENKYVFVDCYASWCGPCKGMDSLIYSSREAGEVFNKSFISLKVQMDSTANDSQPVKNGYGDAHWLMSAYSVAAFPTYLFFSPDGEIVHRDVGFKSIDELIGLAKRSGDKLTQFYTLLRKYGGGEKNYSVMPYLVNVLNSYSDTTSANHISLDFVHNYLDKISKGTLLNKDSLDLILSFIPFVHTEDRVFKEVDQYSKQVDSVKWESFSNNFIDHIVFRDLIYPELWKEPDYMGARSRQPDWSSIRQMIRAKVSAGKTDFCVLSAQLLWLERHKDWSGYCQLLIKRVNRYGPFEKRYPFMNFPLYWRYNAVAWDLFDCSTDKLVLAIALKWADLAVRKNKDQPNPSIVDTYANILYKLGRVNEAILWEEKAIRLLPNWEDTRTTLYKMKHGQKTWNQE